MNHTHRSLLSCMAASLSVLCVQVAVADGASRTQQPIHLTPTSSESKAGEVVALFLSRFHLQPRPIDRSFSRVVFNRLLEDLDPEHMSFTRLDIESFAPETDVLAPSTRNGDPSPAFVLINRYLNRMLEQYQYAQTLLTSDFDLTSNESFDIDRKDVTWASSEAELHDVWRMRAEDDWLRLKLAGQDDDTIRKILMHRYAHMVERIEKTKPEDAFQMFMTAFCESMDPHTDYFAPKTALEFDTEMSLSLVGIGAYLREDDEYVQISELIPGGPAGKSRKVHVGDRIVAVGQGDRASFVDVVGWRADDVVPLIRGAVDSTVRIQLLPDERKGDSAIRTVVLQRRKVSVADKTARASIIESTNQGRRQKIGIITVPSFYEDFDGKRTGDPSYQSVTRDVKQILADFDKAHVDGVLVDLRNNGGGSLTEAAGLAGLFSGRGPVVQVRDASGKVEVDSAPERDAAWTGPLGVLVDHGSASASEIFAAAIQDRKRGVIIGETTFGKGTVQNLVDVDSLVDQAGAHELGELKTTIAQFYRVDGVSTQLIGVKPDIAFPSTGEEKLFGESTYKNALLPSTIPALRVDAGVVQPRLLSLLEEEHEARVSQSPRWKLMLDDIEHFEQATSRTSVSLNFAERKAERDADMRAAKALQERRRKLDQADGLPIDQDDAAVADDGFDPSERELTTEKTPASKQDLTDPALREAAQIVADESKLAIKASGSTG